MWSTVASQFYQLVGLNFCVFLLFYFIECFEIDLFHVNIVSATNENNVVEDYDLNLQVCDQIRGKRIQYEISFLSFHFEF